MSEAPHTVKPASRGQSTEISPEVARAVLAAVRSLRYGAVEITVHDGRVVQIERREKYRFAASPGERDESPPQSA